MKNTIRMILVLLKRDFKNSLNKSIIKYLALFLIFLVINLIEINRLNSSSIYTIFFEIFKGISYDISINDFFFPTTWILINTLILFIIGDYINYDIKRNGVYIITRCGKKVFWISKIIWSFANVLIYYLIIFITSLSVEKIFLKSNIQNVLYDDIYVDLLNDKITDNQMIIYTIILFIMSSIMLVMLYIMFCIIFDSKYVFLGITMLLIASIFIKNNLMPGQHSLLLRHVPFDEENNLTILKSLIYNIGISSLCILIATKLMKKKDIF